jgi:hypothetical protein
VAISNQQLRAAFLSPQMRCYFERKLPDVPPAEVGTRIEETLKFLNMAAYCEGGIPVSGEIDDIWHYWILQTREYAQLCSLLHGRRFIHHSSNIYAECWGEDSDALKGDLDRDVAMLANYVRNYGPFTRDRVKYWRLAAHLVEDRGMSIEDLNSWLSFETPIAVPGRG